MDILFVQSVMQIVIPLGNTLRAKADHCANSSQRLKTFWFSWHSYINFIQQKTFDWLKDKRKLYLDFYLSNYNIAIECQGEQHFKPFKYFGGVTKYLRIASNDELKLKLCKEHNIKVLYFSHCLFSYPHKIIASLNDLKEAILNLSI